MIQQKFKFSTRYFKKIRSNGRAIYGTIGYNIIVRQGGNLFKKGSEEMEKEMSSAQFNAFLETIAKLIESKASTVTEAVEIIREAKVILK